MNSALLVEDDPGTRSWIHGVLRSAFSPNLELQEVGTVRCALAAIQAARFNLLAVDLYLPDGAGQEVIAAAKRRHAASFCVVITAFDDDEDIFTALKAGADGYLLKSQDPARLITQLQGMLEGVPPISPPIARRIIKYFHRQEGRQSALRDRLTPRERQTLQLIAQGHTRSEIAQALQLREGTVAGYVKRVYEKLNVTSKVQAALTARQLGLD